MDVEDEQRRLDETRPQAVARDMARVKARHSAPVRAQDSTRGRVPDSATQSAVHAVAGPRARAALAAGRGRVTAVFQRSLYLDSPAGLACVGGADLPPGPLNLRLEGVDVFAAMLARCRPGDHWAFAGGGLHLGQAGALQLPVPEPWAPRPAAPVSRALLAMNLAHCRAVLAKREPGRLLPGAAGRAVAARLQAGMTSLSRWLRPALRNAGTAPALPGDVLDLLGCGPGLTPSGDDVLVGALVALQQWRLSAAAACLAQALRAELSARTGAISAAHLAAACDGFAVEPVHELLDWLAAGAAGDPGGRVERLCRHGHSSGADALAGIVLVGEVLPGRDA